MPNQAASLFIIATSGFIKAVIIPDLAIHDYAKGKVI
jgi:hypothetical protein